MADLGMTEEQRKFLEECEDEFKDRYTEKDNDFMNIKNMEPKKPPIVDPWYNHPCKPPYDWARQNQGRRNHHWDRRNNENHDRYERHNNKYLHDRRHKPF